MLEENRQDVIVVGAGPAGTSAAHTLAQAGARVLLLDRALFPRDKACGGAVSVEALGLLLEMGLGRELSRWQRWDECRLTSPAGYEARCHGSARADGPTGMIVPRVDFDQALLDAAVSRGARFWGQCTVTGAHVEAGQARVQLVRREGSLELRAPIVIAADGHHSAVARSLGLRHRPTATALAIRTFVEPPDSERLRPRSIELHFDRHLLPGYGWCFPVGPRLLNVGVGMLTEPMRNSGTRLDRLFEHFVRTNPFVRSRMAGARRVSPLRGGGLCMGPAPSHTRRDNFLFVGDAAGFADALTGAGIAAAMRTGRMAAEVALAALGASRFDAARLGDYDRRWRLQLGPSMRVGWRLQHSLHRAGLLDGLIHFAERKAALASLLFEAIAGVLPKTALLRPVILARSLT